MEGLLAPLHWAAHSRVSLVAVEALKYARIIITIYITKDCPDGSKKDGGFVLLEIDSLFCQFGTSRREIQIFDMFCLLKPPGTLDQKICLMQSKAESNLHSLRAILYLSLAKEQISSFSGHALEI